MSIGGGFESTRRQDASLAFDSHFLRSSIAVSSMIH